MSRDKFAWVEPICGRMDGAWCLRARKFPVATTGKEITKLVLDSMANQINEAFRMEMDSHENQCNAAGILFTRMAEWNREWQAENPGERDLRWADAMRLIEWKINRAVRGALRDAALVAVTTPCPPHDKDSNPLAALSDAISIRILDLHQHTDLLDGGRK